MFISEHCQVICGRCNSIILDYEILRKRVSDLKNKIISNFERTLERLAAYDELVLQKYGIMKVEEGSPNVNNEDISNEAFIPAEETCNMENDATTAEACDDSIDLIDTNSVSDTEMPAIYNINESELNNILQGDANSVVTIFAECDDDNDDVNDDNMSRKTEETEAPSSKTVCKEKAESMSWSPNMSSALNGIDCKNVLSKYN